MLPPLLNKINALLQQRPRVERRESKRLSPTVLTPCQIRKAGDQVPRAAWIHNLSKTGVGMLAENEVAVGTTIQVLMVNAAHTAALVTDVKVVRCLRLSYGDFLLGGEFINPLQHDEMVPFIR